MRGLPANVTWGTIPDSKMRPLCLTFMALVAALPLRAFDIQISGRDFREPICPMGCLVKSVLFAEWVGDNWPKDTALVVPLDFAVEGREIRHSVCLFSHEQRWLIYDSTMGVYPLPQEAYPTPKTVPTAATMQFAIQIVVWNQWLSHPLHDTYGSEGDLFATVARFREKDHASYQPYYIDGPALTFAYHNRLFIYLWDRGTRLLENPESSLYSGLQRGDRVKPRADKLGVCAQ
jgi:hypothetical protein